MLRSLYQGSLYRDSTKKCTKCAVAVFIIIIIIIIIISSIILVALSPVADPDLLTCKSMNKKNRSSGNLEK